ncbi:MAG: leucine-rich repeat protein [Chitinispirillales bacterium]|jgi:uncharacterized repeat protein (TIGR02543 family)|nr:leucine-rich repeat protein [Chitinispirillales bacterium]
MKKSIHIKITTMMFLLVVAAQALLDIRLPPPTNSPWKSGETTVTLSDDGVLTVSGKGAMEDYGFYYAFPGAPWLGLNRSIKSIVIEEGVTHIGDGAFMYCWSATSATIPNSVVSIGRGAFWGVGFTSVTIPNSVTSIGKLAFFRTGLTSITIPNSVTSIEERAFAECDHLASATIPGGVMEIAKKNPDSETLIEKDDWRDIKKNTTKIRRGDQRDVASGLGGFVFQNCTKLTSVAIGDGAKAIGAGMFAGCSSLTFITIPNSVTSIGEYAFTGTGLTSITIPPNVMSIESEAFHQSSNLTSIILRNPKITEFDRSAFDFWNGLNIYYPISEFLAPNFDIIFTLFDNRIIKAYNMKTGPWLAVSVLTVLVLFAAILFIIIKSRKSSGRKRTFFRLMIVMLSIFLSLTIYLSVVYATTFSIKIETNLENGGTVSPSRTIKYNVVTEAIVTAKANDGYVFTGWSGASTSTDAKIAVVVDGSRNQTLTANFKPINENEK